MRSNATSARYAQLWIINGSNGGAERRLPPVERRGLYFTFTLGRAATILRY